MSIFGGGGGDSTPVTKKVNVNVRTPGRYEKRHFNRGHLGQVLDNQGQPTQQVAFTPFGASLAQQLQAMGNIGQRSETSPQWEGVEDRFWHKPTTNQRVLRGAPQNMAGRTLTPEQYKKLKEKYARKPARPTSYGGYAMYRPPYDEAGNA